jgi:hypothetical protein
LCRDAASAAENREQGGVDVTDMANDRPKVLLLYYTYTGQSLRVLKAAGEVFDERRYEVCTAEITFTDRRYAGRFKQFPMRHVWRDMLSVLPAQTRRTTGEIAIPDEVKNVHYDLICIGSPTWWGTTSMPVRSFLKSDDARRLLADRPFAVFVVCRRLWEGNLKAVKSLGQKLGGRFVGAIHFEYPGGQLTSLLSMTSYLASGQYRDRYLGVRIPQTNVQPEQLDQARAFASVLAEQLFGTTSPEGGAAPDRYPSMIIER